MFKFNVKTVNSNASTFESLLLRPIHFSQIEALADLNPYAIVSRFTYICVLFAKSVVQ